MVTSQQLQARNKVSVINVINNQNNKNEYLPRLEKIPYMSPTKVTVQNLLPPTKHQLIH